MSAVILVFAIFSLAFRYGYLLNTQVIPERAEVFYYNKDYLTHANVYIRRTSRNSPYYVNWEWTNVAWIGENMTLHAVFYEFLHNEYRRSFVEVEMDACEITTKEPWRTFFGTTLVKKGFICPMPPGQYRFKNITVSMSNFPYVWPFEKVMLEGNVMKLKPTKEIIMSVRFYATLKRNTPK